MIRGFAVGCSLAATICTTTCTVVLVIDPRVEWLMPAPWLIFIGVLAVVAWISTLIIYCAGYIADHLTGDTTTQTRERRTKVRGMMRAVGYDD